MKSFKQFIAESTVTGMELKKHTNQIAKDLKAIGIDVKFSVKRNVVNGVVTGFNGKRPLLWSAIVRRGTKWEDNGEIDVSRLEMKRPWNTDVTNAPDVARDMLNKIESMVETGIGYYDDSDVMSDYFNTSHYVFMSFDSDIIYSLEYANFHKPEKEDASVFTVVDAPVVKNKKVQVDEAGKGKGASYSDTKKIIADLDRAVQDFKTKMRNKK